MGNPFQVDEMNLNEIMRWQNSKFCRILEASAGDFCSLRRDAEPLLNHGPLSSIYGEDHSSDSESSSELGRVQHTGLSKRRFRTSFLTAVAGLFEFRKQKRSSVAHVERRIFNMFWLSAGRDLSDNIFLSEWLARSLSDVAKDKSRNSTEFGTGCGKGAAAQLLCGDWHAAQQVCSRTADAS